MAAKKRTNRALRTFIFFIVIVLALLGTLIGSTLFSNGSYVPKLAIDLEGGTQLILTPKNTENANTQFSVEDINQAIEVIRQRVDASGVAEAEIARNGQENISVGLPGTPSEETLNLVRSSAVMRFRTVLLSAPGNYTTGGDPAASLSQLASGGAPQPTSKQYQVDENGKLAPVQGAPTDSAPTQSLVVPATTPSPQPTPSQDTTSPVPALTPAPTKSKTEKNDNAIPIDQLLKAAQQYPETPAGQAKTVNDPMKITVRDMFIFNHLDCSDSASLRGGSNDNPKKNLVTCDKNGAEKYILGPEVLSGTNVSSAASGMETNQQGNSTGQWQVSLKLDSEGAKKFDAVAKELYPNHAATGRTPDNNRFAIVLDSLVVSSPGINAPAFNGSASISGSLTRESSATLANQLQFGSLPLNFEVQSEQRVSATLGGEHLKVGFYAAILGLILVVLYLLWQYHALAGLATASLVLAGFIVYIVVAILSWSMGYRLSLAGVVGLIVAVGVTMDSFIIYFERIRDEVRDGKPLATAVESGWNRAKRTIVVSDIVNIVAAVVLYVLAVGGVQGFAFTLGLTTLVDLGIIFLFTHPMMSMLVKTRYFGEGRTFSGLDPLHLGASQNTYVHQSAAAVSKNKRRRQSKVAAPTISLARQKAGLPQEEEDSDDEETEETADSASSTKEALAKDTATDDSDSEGEEAKK